MTTRSPGRRQPRRRVYPVLLNAHGTNTAAIRETIASPAKGKRIRVVRVKGIQEYSEGRRIYELYFGTGANIGSNPGKAIDTLDIPDHGVATTQLYRRSRGPRGERNEVLSGRWTGTAPYVGHIILVEYTEES